MSLNLVLDNTKSIAINGKIAIPGSKSESNRLLILQDFFPTIAIENLSNSDDTNYLKKALLSKSETIDIGHSGTAMRFLTAFFATKIGKSITLSGSKRMQERPIKILVKALNVIGASISYLKNEGYPPIHIEGKKIQKNKLSLRADVSSQYISALLLIAPTLSNGLEINLEGAITSTPYIDMTLNLLNEIGIQTKFVDDAIVVFKPTKQDILPKTITVESDWSSASYFYSLVALHSNSQIELSGFKRQSLQGDSVLPEIYKQFGVRTIYNKNGIIIKNENSTVNLKLFTLDLSNTPDLAQTIAITCLGLGVDCHLTGLHTLKIKETDRLLALKNELEKLGAIVQITKDSLKLKATTWINQNCAIETYEDHRMAMSFAPLSVKVPLEIENPEVVSKSYPNFWEDFSKLHQIL